LTNTSGSITATMKMRILKTNDESSKIISTIERILDTEREYLRKNE